MSSITNRGLIDPSQNQITPTQSQPVETEETKGTLGTHGVTNDKTAANPVLTGAIAYPTDAVATFEKAAIPTAPPPPPLAKEAKHTAQAASATIYPQEGFVKARLDVMSQKFELKRTDVELQDVSEKTHAIHAFFAQHDQPLAQSDKVVLCQILDVSVEAFDKKPPSEIKEQLQKELKTLEKKGSELQEKKTNLQKEIALSEGGLAGKLTNSVGNLEKQKEKLLAEKARCTDKNEIAALDSKINKIDNKIAHVKNYSEGIGRTYQDVDQKLETTRKAYLAVLTAAEPLQKQPNITKESPLDKESEAKTSEHSEIHSHEQSPEQNTQATSKPTTRFKTGTFTPPLANATEAKTEKTLPTDIPIEIKDSNITEQAKTSPARTGQPVYQQKTSSSEDEKTGIPLQSKQTQSHGPQEINQPQPSGVKKFEAQHRIENTKQQIAHLQDKINQENGKLSNSQAQEYPIDSPPQQIERAPPEIKQILKERIALTAQITNLQKVLKEQVASLETVQTPASSETPNAKVETETPQTIVKQKLAETAEEKEAVVTPKPSHTILAEQAQNAGVTQAQTSIRNIEDAKKNITPTSTSETPRATESTDKPQISPVTKGEGGAGEGGDGQQGRGQGGSGQQQQQRDQDKEEQKDQK